MSGWFWSATPKWYQLDTPVSGRIIWINTPNYSPDLGTGKIKFKWKDGEQGREHDAEIKYIRQENDFNIWEAYYNYEDGARILTIEPPPTDKQTTSITREHRDFYIGDNLHHIIHMFFHVVKHASGNPNADVPETYNWSGGSLRPRKTRKRRNKRTAKHRKYKRRVSR